MILLIILVLTQCVFCFYYNNVWFCILQLLIGTFFCLFIYFCTVYNFKIERINRWLSVHLKYIIECHKRVTVWKLRGTNYISCDPGYSGSLIHSCRCIMNGPQRLRYQEYQMWGTRVREHKKVTTATIASRTETGRAIGEGLVAFDFA